MRRVRYSVAMSLDGYIAGPNGEIDWITMDPEIDFRAKMRQFDTLLVGRRTFDQMVSAGRPSMPGMKTIVFSRTLKSEDYPGVAIVSENHAAAVAAMKANSGKDMWLFGGGSLFRSLAEEAIVDTVEVAVMPVLIGGGVTLGSNLGSYVRLSLTAHKVYGTGIVLLEYAVR
jgi:dihydrofolate reductase